jgi:glucose-1-phosphate thymidylyltransferase
MTSTRRSVIGVVPAAGRATRLNHCMCSKELLPVGEIDGLDGRRLKAVSEYLIDAMVGAGADRLCIVLNPDKHDIVKFYGSGRSSRVPIAYVCQDRSLGMADAIDSAYPWLRDATVLMGMPDTIVRPADALARLRALHDRERADISLAITPTREPHRLGPVTWEGNGRVVEILDKPETPPHNRVWTVACWEPRVTEYLHAHLRDSSTSSGEVALGDVFQAAVEDGFDVRALWLPDGEYIDIGTLDGLREAQRAAAAERESKVAG